MSNNAAGIFYIQTLLKSQGVNALDRLHSHSFSLNILRMNAQELEQAITLTEHGQFMMQAFAEKNEGASKQVHREANRLAHNYLCSLSTFADHTRNFMNEHYAKTAFSASYQAEVQRVFNSDEYCRFVRDLRNYMTHRGLPVSSLTLNFMATGDAEGGGKTGELVAGIYYGVAEFLEWDGWSSPARRYLEKAGESLSLRSIFSKHFEIMAQFSEWFEQEFRRHHKCDLDELEQLQAEYERLQAADKEAATNAAGLPDGVSRGQ